MSGDEEELTTISLKKKTKTRLDSFKIHPNQSYDEVLNEFMDNAKVKDRRS